MSLRNSSLAWLNKNCCRNFIRSYPCLPSIKLREYGPTAPRYWGSMVSIVFWACQCKTNPVSLPGVCWYRSRTVHSRRTKIWSSTSPVPLTLTKTLSSPSPWRSSKLFDDPGCKIERNILFVERRVCATDHVQQDSIISLVIGDMRFWPVLGYPDTRSPFHRYWHRNLRHQKSTRSTPIFRWVAASRADCLRREFHATRPHHLHPDTGVWCRLVSCSGLKRPGVPVGRKWWYVVWRVCCMKQ